MTAAKTFKIPAKLGAVADLLYETKNRRLLLQKEVDALQAQETQLKEHLIQKLPKSEASGMAGKLARVTVVLKEIPQVKDWPAFYNYVRKHGRFDLMQKRLSDGAVKDMWEAGEVVPGVEAFNAVSVSVNKV